jgi:Fic family protein
MPEKAPPINREDFERILDLTIDEDFKLFANDINKDYLYWDRFKYQRIPKGEKPESAWHALKFIRRSSTNPIPLEWNKDINFSYWLPDIAQELLHFIDKHCSGTILVDEPSFNKKERQRYLIRSIEEEAIASSLLEGAATTRKKAKEMFRKSRKPKNHPEQMIYNNFITIMKIDEYIDKALTPELLLELQDTVTKDTLENRDYEGRFRNARDYQINVADATGRVLHDPPEAAKIQKLVEDLCFFANEDGPHFIHPIIKGIILHFWLAYIHPFMDGNGRTARALFYWFILKHKYWLFKWLSISSIIIKAPTQYYRAFLYSEIDRGDLTYFIRFHLRTIYLAVKDLNRYIERKQKEVMETSRHLVKFPNINYRQKALLTHAIKNPNYEYSLQTHMKAHNIVYETARLDLLDLVKKGLLNRTKKGKAYIFIAIEDLNNKLTK